VDLKLIERRFYAMTAANLRRSSANEYWRYFVRFAQATNLSRMTRRNLESKGKELLLGWASTVPPKSVPILMAGVKKVWRKALDLQWPLESDDLPRVQREDGGLTIAPSREVVQEWVRAAQVEQDPYTKAWFHVELSYGLRPCDQQAELRRKHIVHNAIGQPIGIMVRGRDIGAKKDAWIIAAIPPNVGQVLKEWLDHLPADPDTLLFPQPGTNEKHTHATVTQLRHGFASRHGLRWLTSRSMRHYVRATLIHARMEPMDRNFWQGHKARTSDMDTTYGTEPSDVMTRQLEALPGGPMATFIHKAPEGVKGRRVNWNVQDLLDRVERGEMDRADAMEEIEALLKTLSPRNGRKMAFMASLTR